MSNGAHDGGLRIALFSINYSPEPIGIGPYSAQMAQYLAARGHRVTAIAAKPYYPAWRIEDDWRGGWRKSFEHGVRVVRCPLYVPVKPSGPKRIVHHASFALSSAVAAAGVRLRDRFDIVIAVAPSLVAAPVSLAFARSAGAKAWLHVQDFELEAALATDLLASGSLVSKMGAGVERGLFRRFDRVSSISPQMCARVVEKGVPANRVYELRNWSEPPTVAGSRPDFRREWRLGERIVALYSGNIANKQGIDIIVDAARMLRDRDDIAFVVCGEGPNRQALEQAAGGLGNIQFHDLRPREHLQALLESADVHLLPQRPEAADLVLPSKLCNMLASGRPTVATAAAGTGIAEEIQGCGIATPPGDAAAFAAAIVELADNPALRSVLGREARIRAQTRWSADAILSRFDDELRSLTLNGGAGRRQT